jgi:hypothetical protein
VISGEKESLKEQKQLSFEIPIAVNTVEGSRVSDVHAEPNE